MCGTISPPIFEKRLSRPVMWMKPSVSIIAMSPVMYQPSCITLAVSSGWPKVALHHVRALDQQHARRAERQVFVRFRIDNLRRNARHRPPDRAFLQSIVALFDRLGGTFTETSGDNSVVP